MVHSKFLKVALQAAKKSEKIIMNNYSRKIESKFKEDLSPVTIVDTAAEKIIIETIRKKFPNHGFLGEEGNNENSDSEYLWIIDPMDGTMNYVRRIPLFATQIALMKDGELILGVSNAPALKELMYAEKNKKAFLNNKIIHVSQISNLQKAYMSFGGLEYFEKYKLITNLLSLTKSIHVNRGIGDFWSYHLLAQGKIDIMIEAQTKIWDIAALKVIVEEAGGSMTDLQGKAVDEKTTSIIATNKELHNLVLKHFQ